MPSKHPRIAVTADPELGDALARVRAATGTREADATLLRRLAVEGAEAERYELMVDARGSEGIAVVERTLEGLREVPVDRSVQRAVLATMRELAASGSHGAHRFPLTDLTVAAAAQDAGVGILHFDRRLERLGEHLGLEAHWISASSGE